MKITSIELRKLTPTDGMILTNGETFSKEVYLGENDSPDNWHEITEEEYTAILAEREKANEEGGVTDVGRTY